MSSANQIQINRLMKEIADLRKSDAQEALKVTEVERVERLYAAPSGENDDENTR